MESSLPRPDTINKLRAAADAACAMQAGMELDLFTPLKDGPMAAAQIAAAIGVKSDRLRLLLWALVAAGLLTEQDGRFANTPEANHYLVKGLPSYLGYLHGTLANAWSLRLKTAASLRTGYRRRRWTLPNRRPSNWNRFCAESMPIASLRHGRCWRAMIFRRSRLSPMWAVAAPVLR